MYITITMFLYTFNTSNLWALSIYICQYMYHTVTMYWPYNLVISILLPSHGYLYIA